MKKVLFHGLWLSTSLLFFLSGIMCLIHPNGTIVTLAILLGFSLFLSGINDVITYFRIRELLQDSGWVLMEGIFSILFSIFCFMNQYITALTIPLVFSIWIIFVGISRIVSSLDFKQYGFKSWWGIMLWGILLVLFGILSMLEPIIASLAISFILGIILMSQGINSFIKWYYVQKLFRYFKQVLK